ncbi:MAG: hypothetical protein A2233_02000 [Candidatus Kerfeldbacteria bacterium RIFOXYA2_FULL_38_24]|uniref:Uncharacterized protein n=1 Tax=Candidatus Kerfeldbacteria bacterium RIFOXYB2_FULL_38_14 TaxID=1798547 RepID=A0A1G2BEN6_9BACT|nr:MAG: hypothetical protein A2319_04600 [Candidatus Kerfeldbacteria bacterium RIFOXYB2_FULL_38_14]OGY87888.1 MAG: hypothetical protein A2233_02000 [Candidatus Kerfeldbacteria bacterium RIFOXYA2_FULL_38_24]
MNKSATKFFSKIGLGLLLSLSLVILQGDAWAEDVTLKTSDFSSWGWSGTPVDQTVAQEGSATYTSLGFIHLQCGPDSDPVMYNGDCSPEYNGKIYPSVVVHLNPDDPTNYGNISGWGWLGTTQVPCANGGFCSSPPPKSLGWLNFDPTGDEVAFPGCGYPTEPCVSARLNTENQQEVYGWARLETLSQYGRDILNGSLHEQANDWGWVLLRGTIDNGTTPPDEYGLVFRDNSFNGWVWSGGGTLPNGNFENSVGLGWIQFTPSAITVENSGYFSTELGDVYAQAGITNPDDFVSASANATFLLFGTDNAEFKNFSTVLGDGGTLGDYNILNIPDSNNQYRSTLGRLDLDKLTTVVADQKNVFGDKVQNINSLNDLAPTDPLNGRVLVLGDKNNPQTYQISSAFTFLNGYALPVSGTNYNGAGVIVVYGDLEINANAFYEESNLLDIENLASVAWVVFGNVTIGENVVNTVGAYFVLPDQNGHGGSFITQPVSSAQFVLSGLVMAHDFNLQRTFQGVLGGNEPAELFRYDARILMNTPPGLKDYTSTLPQFK